MAGYSKTPLVKKLGIKADMKVAFVNVPSELNLERLIGTLPDGVEMFPTRSKVDYLHFFSLSKSELRKKFPALKKRLFTTGLMWISWPKASSEIQTDLSRDVVREIGLSNGLVDVKICAVDEVWSGLKFVHRRDAR